MPLSQTILAPAAAVELLPVGTTTEDGLDALGRSPFNGLKNGVNMNQFVVGCECAC